MRGTGSHPLDVAGVLGMHQLMRHDDDPRHTSRPLADALTWADQTTSPTGQTVDVASRTTDMLARRGPDSPNARAHPWRGPETEQADAS